MTSYFIVNPTAGSGRALKAVPVIDRFMAERGLPYKVIYTNQPRDADNISKAIQFHEAERVVCVGGDGTVQEMLPLLMNTGIPMGIIPAGSGNDVAASLPGFKKTKGSLEERVVFYLGNLLNGDAHTLDLISMSVYPKGADAMRLSQNLPETEYFFLNIASVGFDANVAFNAVPLKKTFGKAAYFVSLLLNVLKYKQKNMRLFIDGRVSEGVCLLNSVCNGTTYGGGFVISPGAKMDDGKLTLCSVDRLPRIIILLLFPLVLFGKHDMLKQVSFTDADEIILDYSGIRTVNLDGNLFALEGPLGFKVLKRALKVLI